MPSALLPAPSAPGLSPRQLLGELELLLGPDRAAEACAELLVSRDPHEHTDTLRFLGGKAAESVLAAGSWKPYWGRVWGARGLLYVWPDPADDGVVTSTLTDRRTDRVTHAVLTGLHDDHWRVAEMCLKVSVRRELPAADDAAALAGHELARVRMAAVRVLGTSGEREHLGLVRQSLTDEDEGVRRASQRSLGRLTIRLDLPRSPDDCSRYR